LARRLHETLHVETLEQLEAALHERDGEKVAGVGARRLSMLRASLAQMLGQAGRCARTSPGLPEGNVAMIRMLQKGFPLDYVKSRRRGLSR
jgi:hypothetical protein